MEALAQLDLLKQKIDAQRPWPADVQGRIMQKFRLDWNYHSNAIEGNSLDYGETIAFLMEGLTAKGKPLKDHLDLRGHNQGIDFMMGLIQSERSLTESDIRSLHEIILVEPYEVDAITPEGQPTRKRIELGVYKSQPNHVRTPTGELHYYATPEETPILMRELMEWYHQVDPSDDIHPLVTAVLFHHRFTAIHPFDDGNGRLARLLMNFILMQHRFPPVIVRQETRSVYYAALNQADQGVYLPLFEYLYEALERSLKLQLSGLQGEDIADPEDLDKEVALFVKGMEREEKLKSMKNHKVVIDSLVGEIIPFIVKLREKTKGLDKLFNEISEEIIENFQKLSPPGENDQLTYEDSILEIVGNTPTRFRHQVFYHSISKWYEKLETDVEKADFNDLDNCRLTIKLCGFKGKGVSTDIDFELCLLVEFHPYHYLILSRSNGDALLNYYQSPLDPTESQAFIASQVRYLMREIQEKSHGQRD